MDTIKINKSELKVSRMGNYIDVEGTFNPELEGGFGKIKLHVHASLWNSVVLQLSNIKLESVGLTS